MKQTFYSNGKLLLTGEYMVLEGAQALAVPTKYGQYLEVEPGEKNLVSWKSYDSDGSLWFEDHFTFEDIKNKTSFREEDAIKNTLIQILHLAYLQNPNFLLIAEGYTIITKLTFPRLWGLGTSSTLINNIAQWTNTDPYALLQKSFGGSGYDIACAQIDSPLVYQLVDTKPIIKEMVFTPDFSNSIYFVYLNQKRNSRAAIASFNAKTSEVKEKAVKQINELTSKILDSKSLAQFSNLLEAHEEIMGAILEEEPVKKKLFPDFPGTIKSLGAWGGDFVLVLSENDPKAYFEAKGYTTILPYKEMIK